MKSNGARRMVGCGAALLGLVVSASGVLAASPEPARTPAFDIPQLTAVTVDGKADDWGTDGMRVEVLLPADGRLKSAADLDARLRLGWNERGLLVLLTVHDDDALESESEDALWQNDCVELWLAERRGGSNLVQAIVAPGTDGRHTAVRVRPYDHRKDPGLRTMPPSVTAARSITGDGYVLEALLPWADVGVTPRMGSEVGFQCFVDDSDGVSNRPVNVTWYPGVAPFVDTMRLHRLRLAKSAGKPVTAAGRAAYDGVAGTLGLIVATPETLAGKTAALRVDGRAVATGVLEADAGRAFVRLRGAFPAVGTGAATAELRVGRQVIETVALPDAAAIRERARARLPWVFHPFCFDSDQLPGGSFENPVEAANAFGPHTVRVTYYDAAFKPVTRAVKPGRYGAIVDVRPDKGAPTMRFYTLYRLPRVIDWRAAQRPAISNLPEGMGIPDAIVREQSVAVGEFVKNQLAESLARSPDSAVLLAWLAQTTPGSRATRRTGPWACNERWIHGLKRATGHAQPLPYVAHVPEAVQKAPGLKHPAILFLHGSGERTIPLADLGKQAIFAYAKAHPEYPFILIAPQCPPDQWWGAASLEETVAEVLAKYPIDPDRFYLTGLSMGGFGSWMLSMEHPDWFAAVAPICGGGDPEDVERIRDIPTWNFHGAKDPTVPIRLSNEMVEALRKAHGRVRYTVYTDGGHNVWSEAYKTDELYAWMLRQVRGKPGQAPATEQGAAPTEEKPLSKP